MESNNILVTTDFSTVSFAALAYTAKMQAQQITILSIVPTGDIPTNIIKHMPAPNAILEYREDVLKQTKKKLDAIAQEYFSGMNVCTDAILSNEEAATEICKYADDHAIDTIVMTGQGRGTLGSLFVGSTVQKVLRISKQPVLVVPRKS